MERNIRDVRDIFGCSGSDKQELRSYDYSPRSRRRHEAMDSYDSRITPHNNLQNSENRSNMATNNTKKSSRHRADDFLEPVRASKKSDENQKSSSSKNNKDAAYYANRTLTERDIRHLERHLSMKKTIRKQISRNLTQAFVDDPELVLTDTTNPTTKSSNKVSSDRTFTLTRAKVSKSEQNVLDLLKDNEPDSGHCSADNPNSSDDDSHQEQIRERHVVKSDKNNSKAVHENRNKAESNYKDDGKFSFWKMFSVKNRSKR
ncbi:uncharacterized protein LOC129984209 [Argiope bruennichi]|uniref:uncharacterized protein LOC129984209 n=1 Tax=Argiope bruennichi TaxID=94029 RepID=UPI002494BC51|nr:uncharacterized protein LOC129984209 [Argiope bruennichi]